MKPKVHHLSADAVRSEALFVSALQRSDDPSVVQIKDAIARAVREFGGRGCAERVAQEFGDHPETAVNRMRWARQAVDDSFRVTRPKAVHSRPFASSLVARAGRAA
jgi:hypothetical protein